MEGKKGEDKPATLHELAERGLSKEILKLVERQLETNIEEKDKYGRTPLHWAAEMGHDRTAEVLLDLGAKITTVDMYGRTAIHLAARAGNDDMLKTLLEDLASENKKELVNGQDNKGITPLFLAGQKGEEAKEAFKYLLSCGATYNEQIHQMKSQVGKRLK